MKNIAIVCLILFGILWYFFGKLWLINPNENFEFSDRDKTMVFPTQKTFSLEESTPAATPQILKLEEPTLEIKSSSDTSDIRF